MFTRFFYYRLCINIVYSSVITSLSRYSVIGDLAALNLVSNDEPVKTQGHCMKVEMISGTCREFFCEERACVRACVGVVHACVCACVGVVREGREKKEASRKGN